ncbi:MAG: carboxylating nicotinate-nucleotide diphosphorylase [Promicromonosporaceae bacterium]|nr:carboxylating nicotinate-nucleotide diphosphorylase [Promicromonosporaceae bacterium]
MTATLDDLLRRALAEDSPWGDLTSEAFIPVTATARAALVAREPGVASGLTAFARTFALVDGGPVACELTCADGEGFAAGQVLATVSGPARAVLRAERVGLNLVQRLSGIATLTARYVAEATRGVEAARDTTATRGATARPAPRPAPRIVDTRKTTPGLRQLEKAAVRHGGGHNHRFSLSDAVMAKDNHLAVLTAAGLSVGDAIRAARERLPHTTTIEVEVDRLDQVEEVVAAGVDTIMLDNFSPADLAAGVALVAGRCLVEASGGINLDTVAAVAATGVDLISVGALTHGVASLDLGLDVEVSAGAGAGNE